MWQRRLLTASIGILCAATLFVAWANTWVERVKQPGMGRFTLTVDYANAILAPIAVLLLAFGVQWLLERRWLRAALALPPLLAWSLTMLLVENWFANQVWILIFLAPMQGIQPFGQP